VKLWAGVVVSAGVVGAVVALALVVGVVVALVVAGGAVPPSGEQPVRVTSPTRVAPIARRVVQVGRMGPDYPALTAQLRQGAAKDLNRASGVSRGVSYRESKPTTANAIHVSQGLALVEPAGRPQPFLTTTIGIQHRVIAVRRTPGLRLGVDQSGRAGESRSDETNDPQDHYMLLPLDTAEGCNSHQALIWARRSPGCQPRPQSTDRATFRSWRRGSR
jgi:hypothetical protein